MNYKGYLIEFNPQGKRGNDYIFTNMLSNSEPVRYGRSIANVKNQIDLITAEIKKCNCKMHEKRLKNSENCISVYCVNCCKEV